MVGQCRTRNEDLEQGQMPSVEIEQVAAAGKDKCLLRGQGRCLLLRQGAVLR